MAFYCVKNDMNYDKERLLLFIQWVSNDYLGAQSNNYNKGMSVQTFVEPHTSRFSATFSLKQTKTCMSGLF